MGSTVLFDREIWGGGVSGVGDVDINDASDGKVGEVFSLSRTEIFFRIGARGIGLSTPLLMRTE